MNYFQVWLNEIKEYHLQLNKKLLLKKELKLILLDFICQKLLYKYLFLKW